MSQTLITSRDPKGLQIANLFDVTLNKAYLDHERAQRLIENGGEFQEGLAQLIERCSAISKFAEEEVARGRPLPGLFPNTGPEAKRDFEAWKLKHGRK